MKFIDFHCDTAMHLVENKNIQLKSSGLKVDIEKLKKASGTQFFAFFIYGDAKESKFDKCVEMMNHFKDEVDKNSNDIMICRNIDDYFMAEKLNKVRGFMSIEEGEAIEGDIEKLRFFKKEGVSLITLTWNFENHIGYPNCEKNFMNKGLKRFGIEAVEEMNRLGMLIDVSHLSDGGFWDVMKYSKYPVVASHSNSRVCWNHSRNLTDDMIKALSNNGGLTGINYCSAFLGEPKVSTVADMVRHIKHIRNVGGIECVGLGSDFDGIDNEVEIKDVTEMYKLEHALSKEGFSQDDIEKIFYKNGERVIRDVLK